MVANAIASACTPARASAPVAAMDPTLATSIEVTSGITVIRMRLVKIVPTGPNTAATDAADAPEREADHAPARDQREGPGRHR